MAKVLTSGSQVVCGHGGSIKLVTSSKLKISGNPVVTLVGPAVSGCGTPVTAAGNKPCATASPVGGQAVKLKAGGSPVMLDTVSGVTDGVPPGAITATAAQSKLTAT
jgi:hypothetical protein